METTNLKRYRLKVVLPHKTVVTESFSDRVSAELFKAMVSLQYRMSLGYEPTIEVVEEANEYALN